MTAKIRFSMICSKTFADLEGSDPLERHCAACNHAVVHLDALTDAAREEILTTAARAEMRFCGSTSGIEIEAAPSCGLEAALLKARPLAGAVMPPAAMAEREAKQMAERLAVAEAEAKIREVLRRERVRLGYASGEPVTSWASGVVRRITGR
jgi:hypothetical protein